MVLQKTTFMNAVRDGIAEEMRRDAAVIIIGEGIGERGGSFGQTKGLWHEFGAERVIDTPISENGFMGMAVGAAVTGLKPIVDVMFADFLYELMSPLCQQGAKLSYMSNGGIQVPVVIRAQMGAKQVGPHHSSCLYPIFMHIPGLKVVAPSNGYKAKGLIKSAIRDKNPVMFFENKFAYAEKVEIPEEEYTIPLGKADVVKEGGDVTVVAISTMVGKALRVATDSANDADIEIIDLMTLYPLDIDTIIKSVRKTGRLIVVEEAYLTCNAGAEIAAQVCQNAFEHLKSPIVRVATKDIPHPYSPILETAMLPNEQDIKEAIKVVIGRSK
jgi:acetoin:2,6-dichlorophenolindophenol oxidoreductase subunit beta